MKTYSPDLCFKGSRDYVHGTSLYEAILDGAARTASKSVDGLVRIDIRGLLRNQGNFHFQTRDELHEAPASITASFSVGCGDRIVKGWVTDARNRVVRRVPYDESLIWEALTMNENRIWLHGTPPFDPIEICAAMAVRLHNHLAPPKKGKKWLLSRIEFDHGIVSGDLKGLALKHLQTIANCFTKTEVRNSQGVFGFLYFSLGSVR